MPTPVPEPAQHDLPESSDASEPRSRSDLPGRQGVPVVGIGASAGGLAALELFFRSVATDTGAAFVVVTHQPPGHVSLLPELLGKFAKIPVLPVTDGRLLEPNHAYVALAHDRVSVHDGRLRAVRDEAGGVRLPIDGFFRSLAGAAHDNAIAVVLSGSGSDGTLGIAEIKNEAGMVIAQDPASAEYNGMPASAIATRLVDFVLPPEKMPAQIAQLVQEREGRTGLRDRELHHVDDDAMQQVLALLRKRTGHDFSAYKKSTLVRRIERRISVHGLRSAADYTQLLDRAPFEIDALFKELLISVTRFFRDPEVFVAFEEHLIRLVQQKPDESVLRGWIPGCATGEEAYSLAITVREVLQQVGKNLKVQLFATDLDPHAIELARVGRYPDGIADDVTQARLRRFFTQEDSGYRIHKDIRDMLVFAPHNVTKDPPFTKLDFLSCRNLLIYLEPQLQRRVLGLFAYSLSAGGLLLLGTSESVTGLDDRFTLLDKRSKLFTRRQSHDRAVPVFSADTSRTKSMDRVAPPPRSAPRASLGIALAAERAMMEHFLPPSVIISERGEIVYLYGRTGPFLEPAPGEPSTNLFDMAREGLRLELPSAVRRAAAQGQRVVRSGLRVKPDGGFSAVTLSVHRLGAPESLRGLLLVSFQVNPDVPEEGAPEAVGRDGAHAESLAALEQELQHAKENLQGTIEELEVSNEELTSTNEELHSTNEELQSANEELETSREEMQSLNEELQTVNAELQERNRALSQASDDMENLLNSTEVATIFLDDRLAIKRFTHQAKKVFSLIDTDIGRPIADLAANLRYTRLVEDAGDVLRTLIPHEVEIQTKQATWRAMRIMPYRTHDNAIDGLVVTFIDIDRSKRAEHAAQLARAYAENIVEAMSQALLVLDEDLRVVSANHAFRGMFPTLRLESGTHFGVLIDGLWKVPGLRAELERVLGQGVPVERFRLPFEDVALGTGQLVLSARALAGAADQATMILVTIERTGHV